MRNVRQVVLGIVIAVVSLGLTVGALALSMAEGSSYTSGFTATPTTTLSPVPSLTPTQQTPTPQVVTATAATPSETPTLTSTPTTCPTPLGWMPYTVQSGDTLDGLAAKYKRTTAEISQANCLGVNGLQPGMTIYLPPLPTRTPVPCGRPAGWVQYVVMPGDTLYRLSQAYAVTVTELQRANCMTSTLLHVYQTLFVPPWAPIETPTYPPFIYDTETPTGEFPTAELPTDTPTP